MNFNEFNKVVIEKLEERLGEEVKIKYQEVRKNNNVIFHGISFFTENFNISPTLYLENYYQLYLNNATIEEILENIINTYQKEMPHNPIHMKFFMNFELIKDKIVYRLINK